MEKVNIHETFTAYLPVTIKSCSYKYEREQFIFKYKHFFNILHRLIKNNEAQLIKMHKTYIGDSLVTKIRERFNFSPKTYNWDILYGFYKEYKKSL